MGLSGLFKKKENENVEATQVRVGNETNSDILKDKTQIIGAGETEEKSNKRNKSIFVLVLFLLVIYLLLELFLPSEDSAPVVSQNKQISKTNPSAKKQIKQEATASEKNNAVNDLKKTEVITDPKIDPIDNENTSDGKEDPIVKKDIVSENEKIITKSKDNIKNEIVESQNKVNNELDQTQKSSILDSESSINNENENEQNNASSGPNNANESKITNENVIENIPDVKKSIPNIITDVIEKTTESIGTDVLEETTESVETDVLEETTESVETDVLEKTSESVETDVLDKTTESMETDVFEETTESIESDLTDKNENKNEKVITEKEKKENIETAKIKEDTALKALNLILAYTGPNAPKEKIEFKKLPNYEVFGRGLVYNCSGEHTACVDKEQYLACRHNRWWSSQNKKDLACKEMGVFVSTADCENAQQLFINRGVKISGCKIN